MFRYFVLEGRQGDGEGHCRSYGRASNYIFSAAYDVIKYFSDIVPFFTIVHCDDVTPTMRMNMFFSTHYHHTFKH